MKSKPYLLLALVGWFALCLLTPSRAEAVSFDFFFDALSPYGEWMEVADYGYCWRPSNVDRDWSPYSDGYWAYTDGGWTWVSYEDFGGIVYHYGRWTKIEDEGWCWVPDYQWAPAWVSWRHSEDYIGWAPLPPEAVWEPERGFSVWVDAHFDIAPVCFNFCHSYDFGAPVLREVIVNRVENVTIVNRTVNITNITYNNSSAVVFNGGPSFAAMNHVARRPIPALKLVINHDVAHENRRNGVRSLQQGNQLVVVAPTVSRPNAAELTALVRPKVTRVIPQDRVTKGWAGVSPAEHATLKAKLQQETKGASPQTAAARPFQASEIASVPVKGNPKAVLPSAAKPGKLPKTAAATEPAIAPEPAKTRQLPVEAPVAGNPLIKPFNARGNPGAENVPPAHKGAPQTIAGENPAMVNGENRPARAPANVDAAAAARRQAAAAAQQEKSLENAANQQRMLQQAAAQKQAAQAAQAQRATEQQSAARQQMEQQSAARERAAQAAEARDQRARAVEHQREAPPVRQMPVERAPVQQAPVQPLVPHTAPAPAAVPHLAPAPVAVPHTAPAPGNPKRKLTPAEEAAAQRGQ